MPHASRQQIVRYDIEDHVELTDEESARFASLLRDQISVCQAALISDYGYGVVTPGLAANLTGFSKGRPVTLDSRYNLLGYPGVTAATPNEDEAAAAAGISLWEDDNGGNLKGVAEALQQSLDCEALLITRGSRGMALFEPKRDPLFIPVYGTDPGRRCHRRRRHRHRDVHARSRGGCVVRGGGEARELRGRNRRHEDGNRDRVERRAAARDRAR